jgi:hypothetical protein
MRLRATVAPMSSAYPAWDRPAYVGDTPIRELPKDLATRYCAWFADQVPVRAAGLLSILRVGDSGDAVGLLERVDDALRSFATAPNFWIPSQGPQPIQLRIAVAMVDVGATLTPDGEALGLDLGALIARELERSIVGLDWAIDRSRKDFVSFNRPLLRSGTPPPFDAWLVGTNCVMKAVETPGTPIGLPALFETWQQLLSPAGDPPPS